MPYFIQESKYDFFHIKWVSIKYDRDLCIKFVKEYESALKQKNKKTISLYEHIIKEVGTDLIKNLCDGDYETCRKANIEKLARECAMDILLYGQYTKESFRIVSHLPTDDYKLILKRSQELVNQFKDIKIEEETAVSKIPGM